MNEQYQQPAYYSVPFGEMEQELPQHREYLSTLSNPVLLKWEKAIKAFGEHRISVIVSGHFKAYSVRDLERFVEDIALHFTRLHYRPTLIQVYSNEIHSWGHSDNITVIYRAVYGRGQRGPFWINDFDESFV